MKQIEELEYIQGQLTYIRTKVELDNQLGLYDINKLCENIFMHILNDVYSWNLKNANLIQENFPAIDLVDDVNKLVIQVTSTTSSDKLRGTIKKFKKLTQYSDYKLKIFYIKSKPNFQKDILLEFQGEGVSESDLIGIDDILREVQADQTSCTTLYKTIQQRMDNISFKFNIDSYFEKVEPHLLEVTNNKFKVYVSLFEEFIAKKSKILEIYGAGGNGKSHLLRYLSNIETEYIPLIFTKQINIEEDLKKLDPSKKYLLMFDDIDRFLDQPVFVSLLSYALGNDNIKLIITYRTASKNIVETFYRKYPKVDTLKLEIIWTEEEIQLLIKSLKEDVSDAKCLQIAHVFNNNPYLITQAFRGNIETVKDFSRKVIDDTKKALGEFEFNEVQLQELLFTLSLVVPIAERSIEQYFDKKVIQKLEEVKILRKLASKYRFNPDILGDLYLANYIDENKSGFEDKIEELLPIFSDTLFTNLSYALQYNHSDSLQIFIKRIIRKWDMVKDYRNNYLQLVNKVISYAPEESFVYLQNATSQLKPKEIDTLGEDGILTQLATKYSPEEGDWSSPDDAINLESIEPITSKLVYALKNNFECGSLTIKHIIDYLSSEVVLNLKKPYYDNQTLESIFKQIVSPLNTRNFKVISDALDILVNWQFERPINFIKINILGSVLKSLLNATFEERKWEGRSLHFGRTALNLEHVGVLSIIEKTKDILFSMLKNDDEQVFLVALNLITDIGGHDLGSLSKKHQKFYNQLKEETLKLCIEILKEKKDIHICSEIEDVFIQILRFTPLKDESLSALSRIKRTDKYIFYRLVKGEDLIIIDFQQFYDECKKQSDVREWIYQNQVHKIGETTPTEDEKAILERLGGSFKSTDEIIELFNTLNTEHYDSYNLLLRIFKNWHEQNIVLFNEVAKEHIESINNVLVQNALKEFSLTHGLCSLKTSDIESSTSIEDLKVYINSIFYEYSSDKHDILKRIVEIIDDKDVNVIRMFISIISQRIYFTIAENNELYYELESILIEFLKWQQVYALSNESYITHHILYDVAKKNEYEISPYIIELLKQIVENSNIQIDEFELKPIYKILEYGLEEIVKNIYQKLVSKKEDGTYKHYFMQYFDHSGITEVLLVKTYVKSYDDFVVLIDKSWDYWTNPVETVRDENGQDLQLYVHKDYFFKYAIHKEYVEKYFDELHRDKDIDKIEKLYSIIPVTVEYVEIISKNLNALDGIAAEDEITNYLSQIGKMRMYSSGHMQNSPELLAEEAVLEKILERVNSLSLQLKIKEELKYIEIRKREEIESDISHLLEK